MNKLMEMVDNGEFSPEETMDFLSGGFTDETEVTEDYPYGNMVEPYDIEKELELLSENDPFTGAILNSEE